MSRNSRIYVGLLFILLFALPDGAEARPWRRRRTSSSSYQRTSWPVRLAQKLAPGSGNMEGLRVFYDYDRARQDGETVLDRIRVFLRLRDERVTQAEGPLVAEVQLTDLTVPDKTSVKRVPVSLREGADGDERLGQLEVVDDAESEVRIKPASVYRVFVNLHQKAPTQDEVSALGRVPTPYYVATSGPKRLDRARYQIVMRTFKEFYYTEKGWRSDENCPLDCHAYYRWATSFCTVGAVGGRANLSRLFGPDEESHTGAHLADLAKQESVAADYVRIPGHTFMLLAYDAERREAWTMESNFNRTIEVAIRPVSSGWTIGHLAEEHIRPEPFEVARTD